MAVVIFKSQNSKIAYHVAKDKEDSQPSMEETDSMVKCREDTS